MGDINDLSRNLNAFVNMFDEWTDSFLHKFDAAFIDLNQAQMLDGEMPSGNVIGYLRSQEYISLKKSIGSKAAPKVDLHLTGDFQEKMKIDSKFNISSSDEKMPKLVSKYGEIFGVQDSRLEEFSKDQIAPEMIDEILKDLGV